MSNILKSIFLRNKNTVDENQIEILHFTKIRKVVSISLIILLKVIGITATSKVIQLLESTFLQRQIVNEDGNICPRVL
jgi:hypothetical protein